MTPRLNRCWRTVVGVSRRAYHARNGVYGHPPSTTTTDDVARKVRADQALLSHLVEAYRTHGHRCATLDPLQLTPQRRKPTELDVSSYEGLSTSTSFDVGGLLHSDRFTNAKLEEIVAYLDQKYCGPISIEFQHLASSTERLWLAENYEKLLDHPFDSKDRLKFAELMIKSQNFDHFLASKFSMVKRYGGEGAESMMPFLYHLFAHCSKSEIDQVMIGIAHRGRLNLLTLLLDFPPVLMFRKMKGKLEFPDDVKGSGDVLSHLVSSIDKTFDGPRSVHVSMLANPSHLEAVNPVACGKVRARMQSLGVGDYAPDDTNRPSSVLCLQIHGDASFSGQGVVSETLNLSQTPHFRIGGSVHLITNNQIGFTAEAHVGRSSLHCTDIAKSVDCPVIHVNGERPELVAKSAQLSLEYRQRFGKDVFVNLVCYRRWGHNELDDPSFTQPLMYERIGARKSVPDIYADQLEKEGVLSPKVRTAWLQEHNDQLSDASKRFETEPPVASHLRGNWFGITQAPNTLEVWDTGVDLDLLRFVGAKSVETPKDMNLHGHLRKVHCEARLKKITDGQPLDWATGEALAFGSLLLQGYPVRISGQDVGRGTFSHRHVMLVDQTTDAAFLPLNHISDNQPAKLEVANSLLSEEAVLGFEYGMSIESPRRLNIWEAQFGDFFNGAQIVIDTFVANGEAKWLTQSGLVMLLPHGFDGAGPDHSSCHLERFLQSTDSIEAPSSSNAATTVSVDGDDVNFHVVQPTTTAQYFHLLRRQMIRRFRKPLIVASPKILLRLPAAASTLAEMAPASHFHSVIGDTVASQQPSNITKVILCSGKHYYALERHRAQMANSAAAIIRLEALCPFPVEQLRHQLNQFPNAEEFIWSQEEPRNAGAWSYVRPRVEHFLGTKLEYAGRPALAHVATAIGVLHQAEHDSVLTQTFQ